MTDLLEEVLSDKQYESRLLYFKKSLPFVIVLTVCIVFAIICYEIYDNKNTAKRSNATDILLSAIFGMEADTIDKLNSINVDGIKELALIKKVESQIKQGHYADAKNNLSKIASNDSFCQITREYSKVLLLCLLLDQEVISDDEKQKYAHYIESLSAKGNIFANTASLIKAFWFIKDQNLALALTELKTLLSKENVELSIKNEVKALLQQFE